MSFPTRWHYDILWGLDYLRRAGVTPDERIGEAIDLVRKKRGDDGGWPLENPYPGPGHFEMEGLAGAEPLEHAARTPCAGVGGFSLRRTLRAWSPTHALVNQQ